ncbi:MAG: hypothetical protein PHZ26_03950 [Candidatus Gracilibacteria bacterium]|nr:hypothetical protein [Candidatus Gracilibacteria bacterium]MDD2908881.1 hypothetical protein [Candidatus Gracilibacteria bacterium]
MIEKDLGLSNKPIEGINSQDEIAKKTIGKNVDALQKGYGDYSLLKGSEGLLKFDKSLFEHMDSEQVKSLDKSVQSLSNEMTSHGKEFNKNSLTLLASKEKSFDIEEAFGNI